MGGQSHGHRETTFLHPKHLSGMFVAIGVIPEKVKEVMGEITFFQNRPPQKGNTKAFTMAEKVVFHNRVYLWVFLYHCDY